LATRIRSDPNILQLLRQIVAQGATTQDHTPVGAIEGEQQLIAGGNNQPKPARGYHRIGIGDTIVQELVHETALNDHEYFQQNGVISSESQSSIMFSSNSSFDLDSILQHPQQQDPADLFPSTDTRVTMGEYFQEEGINSAISPNNQVPASPNLNIDPDFPQLGDDILQQALQSLGDLTKFAESNESSSATTSESNNTIGFDDFLQNDDYCDLAWEESFAQLFPSLTQ
jgi:hypothetical protein